MRITVGWPIIDEREVQAVLKALREKRLSQGKFVREFEEAWAKFVGRRFAVAVNSGSSANLVAIQAMKELYRWKDGDAVLVPALTFPTAVSPVIQANLKPIYVDVDRRGNMTLANIERAIKQNKGRRMKGMVLVHSLGVPALDAVKIKRFARKKKIRILEDACESHGAKVGGRNVGTFGDASTTSFFVAHNMTTGEGGMIVTDDKDLAELMRSIREFGRRILKKPARYVQLASGPHYDIRYAFDRLGYNVRMTDIEAAIGLIQLAKLGRMNQKRRETVAWFRTELRDLIQRGLISLPDEPQGTRNTYYTLLITLVKLPKGCRTSIDAARKLEAAGIETRTFMGGNLLRQKAFAKTGPKPEKFPGADFLHHRSFFVGCHPGITKSDVHHVVKEVSKLYSD